MSGATPRDPVAFTPHDHGRCRSAALAAVVAECRARRLRLTPAREHVLESLLESHRAMTAYELLDRLRAAGLGSQPPIVYRALDFLIEHGFVHRVERLGAFVACTHGTTEHAAAFLVCRSCRLVAETDLTALAAGLAVAAGHSGFHVERVTVEAEGVCAICAEASA